VQGVCIHCSGYTVCRTAGLPGTEKLVCARWYVQRRVPSHCRHALLARPGTPVTAPHTPSHVLVVFSKSTQKRRASVTSPPCFQSQLRSCQPGISRAAPRPAARVLQWLAVARFELPRLEVWDARRATAAERWASRMRRRARTARASRTCAAAPRRRAMRCAAARWRPASWATCSMRAARCPRRWRSTPTRSPRAAPRSPRRPPAAGLQRKPWR